jgi:hypothetical protein
VVTHVDEVGVVDVEAGGREGVGGGGSVGRSACAGLSGKWKVESRIPNSTDSIIFLKFLYFSLNKQKNHISKLEKVLFLKNPRCLKSLFNLIFGIFCSIGSPLGDGDATR